MNFHQIWKNSFPEKNVNDKTYLFVNPEQTAICQNLIPSTTSYSYFRVKLQQRVRFYSLERSSPLLDIGHRTPYLSHISQYFALKSLSVGDGGGVGWPVCF